MNEYKSLKKKNNSVFGVLIALLLLFEACALVMLGSRLTTFSGDTSRNVFSLVRSDARTTVRVGRMDDNGQITFPESQLKVPAAPYAMNTFRPLDASADPVDENTIWNGITNVELFKVSYENGEGKVTVDGGADKVIAPGTSNAYIFTLDNSGNFALDYSLDLSAFVNFSDHEIPIKVRLRTADGGYAVGSEDTFEDVLDLNGMVCESTIGAGRQHTYTLDWEWAFEGDDAYDTYLGNLAVEGQEVTLTVVIETNAMQSTDPDNSSGDLPPTGDDNSTFWWLLAALAALAGLYLVYQAKNRRSAYDTL